jgi:hypothetical protein
MHLPNGGSEMTWHDGYAEVFPERNKEQRLAPDLFKLSLMLVGKGNLNSTVIDSI